MNARTNNWNALAWPRRDGAQPKRGAANRWRAIVLAVSGPLLLSVAGCGHQPTVVTVDRPVYLPAPASCLDPVEWDRDADPLTNGDLWQSWLDRGTRLEVVATQIDCLRQWDDEMRARFSIGSP